MCQPAHIYFLNKSENFNVIERLDISCMKIWNSKRFWNMFNFIPEHLIGFPEFNSFWSIYKQFFLCFFLVFIYLFYLFIMAQINVLIILSPPSCTNMVCKDSVKPSACMSEGSYISALCLHTRKCSINMAQHSYALYMGTRLKTIPSAHAQLGSDGGARCWGRWRSGLVRSTSLQALLRIIWLLK